MADSSRVLATRDIKVFKVAHSATNVLPANTVLWGTAWGTPAGQSAAWVEAGYTIGGVQFQTEVTRQPIRVDQELDEVLRPATGRTAQMNANLAEITPQNINDATGQGTVSTTAATTAVRGYVDWDMSSVVDDEFYSIGFDVKHQDDEAFRIFGVRGQTVGSPSISVTPEAAAVIPLNLVLLPEPSTGRILKIRDVEPIAA